MHEFVAMGMGQGCRLWREGHTLWQSVQHGGHDGRMDGQRAGRDMQRLGMGRHGMARHVVMKLTHRRQPCTLSTSHAERHTFS